MKAASSRVLLVAAVVGSSPPQLHWKLVPFLSKSWCYSHCADLHTQIGPSSKQMSNALP
jgi:hypothetical protein